MLKDWDGFDYNIQLSISEMIDFGVGVTTTASYEVKKIDADYFTEN